jgi:hypothetical protein
MPLINPIADTSQNVLTPPLKVITVDLNGNYEGGGASSAPSYSTISGPVATDPYQATVFAPGHLRVALPETQLFYDAFDTGLDTTNRWKTPTTGNGGVAAVSEVADTRLGTGTTANGYSVLESQMNFLQVNPGFVAFTAAINLEFPLVANAYRFWGFATSPSTPTATAPLTEAAGFEVTTAGKLRAIVYQTGTPVVIADLSASTGSGKQPQDSATHKYYLFYRGELMYWCIDSLDNVVATVTSGANGPNVNALPLKFMAIGAATPPVSNVQLQINSVWTGDTARNTAQMSDGVFPWRKATITALHNSDNQALPTSPASYGLLTGGVAQLINPLGNLDRQREAGQDQISPLGVSLGATAFAQAFATTVPTTGTLTTGGASGTITPASMTGIQVGAILTVDTGANAETVVVTTLPSGTTATVVPTNGSPAAPSFLHTHTPSYNVTGFLLNQERDASGENSGASGKGTAVAAEYEYVSGGPPLANGTPSQLQYDREVAALGKVASNAGAGFAITSTTAGDTIITPTTAANFKTLTPGQWVRLSGAGGGAEYVRVADAYTIATAPATVALTSPVVNTGQTTATWDTFGASGPGTNQVLWTGEGFEGVLLNDATNAGFARAWQGDISGAGRVTLQASANAITASATAAAAAQCTANLPAVASKTNYLTGLIFTTNIGGASATATMTVTGLITGTLNLTGQWTTSTGQNIFITFPSPIPASAVNTAITFNLPATASTGASSIILTGFVQ